MFKLGPTSILRLQQVHSDLVKVVERAIQLSEIDFTVLEGIRTKERQAELLKAGATTTMNSRHLTGHAVDLGALVGGKVRWDWPLYFKIADAMKAASAELSIPVEWGGDWKKFKDGPHWQLPHKEYPA
jgi:peptidoglycan L-alanyl-D-glutamate endopeptidase CwlK